MPPNVVPAALVQGDIQVTPLIGTATRAALQGHPLKVVATLTSRPTYAILADSSLTSVPELRGKRIVSGPATATPSVVLLELLRRYGLGPSDVEIMPVAQNQTRITLLLERQAEALVTDLDVSLRLPAQEPRLRRITDPMMLESQPTHGVAVSEQFLREQPDVVEWLIRAHLDATRVIQSRPADAQAVYAKEFDLSPDQARELWELMVPLFTPDGLATDAMLEEEAKQDGQALGRAVTLAELRQIFDATLVEKVGREMGLRGS
jgi:ABC-type nitrate/sulfonate/bicarbonate transport system substrate-binding protein